MKSTPISLKHHERSRREMRGENELRRTPHEHASTNFTLPHFE